jgi:UDP-glucose 4-epimerase
MVNRCLITGGCGFIGTSLIKKIIKDSESCEIQVLDNLSVGTKKNLEEVCDLKVSKENKKSGQNVFLHVGDIRNYEDCFQAAQGMNSIVHLAANTGVEPSVEDPRMDLENNIIGTFNLLEAARNSGVQKFIFASSGAPAGEITPPIHEEVPPHPVSPYGASKLAGEGYCSAYSRTFGINTTILRFGNVYGPRSMHKSSVIAKFIRKALAGEVCKIYGDGTQTRDFIYIDDLVNSILLALKFEGQGEIFQIATGTERTISEIAEILRKELNVHRISMRIEHTDKRLGDVNRNYADISKAKTILGWEPLIELSAGIKKTVESNLR